jgi:hypothetical protein
MDHMQHEINHSFMKSIGKIVCLVVLIISMICLSGGSGWGAQASSGIARHGSQVLANGVDAGAGAPAISLAGPADNTTGVSTPPTLQATVTDPDLDVSSVTFYGRPVGAGTASDFMLVLIPDPQNESQNNPAMFNSMTNWIVSNKTSKNIVYVTATGDMVNTSSSATQYGNADAAIDILDAGGVWYTMATGNHDIAMGSTLYANYFGISRYTGYQYSNGFWFGGSYDNYNTYSLFSADGMDFILINLQYNPPTAVLNWADALLSTYSSRRAIVEQHDILNIDNSWNNQASYNALRDHNNLFLMLCGHMHSGSDGAAYVAGSGTGGAGQTIHVVQADYQDMNNGNGYLRLFRFSPANDMIYMTTYSPYSGGFTSSPDQMNLAYDMTASAPYTLIGTVNGVASGATASLAWNGLAASIEYEWYAVANDGVNSTPSSVWSFTTGVNSAPTDLNLSPATVAENAPLNTVVGALTSTDPNPGDTFTYSLASGAGDTDNISFNISGTNLRTSTNLDFETKASYSVRVRTTDQTGLYTEKALTISVTNVNETYSIPLSAGWNLVSFNLHPLSTAIDQVLADISGKYSIVYAWDATGGHASSGNWLKYDPTAPFGNSLTDLDETIGFWIYMTVGDTLDITGNESIASNIPLSTLAGGWNLVGYPSNTAGGLPDILSTHGVGSDFSVVYAYHVADTGDPWKLYDPGYPFSDLTSLTPGWGYWIYVTADHTWDVAY